MFSGLEKREIEPNVVELLEDYGRETRENKR